MKVLRTNVLDEGSNAKTTNKASSTSKISNSVAPQKVGASFVSSITSAVQNATNTMKQIQVDKSTTKKETTTKTVVTQSVHYQPQIDKIDSFIAYFDNASKYIDDAINKLKEGLIVNDATPFNDKTNTIRTNMSNLRNSLKTEIIPELSKSR